MLTWFFGEINQFHKERIFVRKKKTRVRTVEDYSVPGSEEFILFDLKIKIFKIWWLEMTKIV